MQKSLTRVVELTPPGRGAVAVVLVEGSEAVRTVDRCFTPAGSRRLAEASLGRIMLGRWGGATGEELVVCRRNAERVEVHCHGGSAAVAAVVERLEREGCRRATWQEWLRATEAGTIRAAARIALADAPTARAAAILLDQFHGALEAAIRAAAAAIAKGDWSDAARSLAELLEYGELGRHLTTPWRVVLAGPPNVGKSSLINALAGYERAIVSHEPGTTRDVVTATTAIDGWPVELADTAGLRSGGGELEAAGMALAAEAMARADLIVTVRDARDSNSSFELGPNQLSRTKGSGSVWQNKSTPLAPREGNHLAERDDYFKLTPCGTTRQICVRNKIDLLPSRGEVTDESDVILTSAVTGEGIANLLAAIGRTLVPHAPPAGLAVPFTAEQVAMLEAAQAAVARHDSAGGAAALQALLAR